MLFCPKCGGILVPKSKKKRLGCKCGYTSKKKEKDGFVVKEKINLKEEDKIEIIDKKIETHPKTNEECPKCGNNEAYYWTVQTRAADEAETRFFECTKCKNRWRAYD